MFKSKEGYSAAMVRKTGTTMTEAKEKAEKAFLAKKPSFSDRLKRRMDVAEGLYKNMLKDVKAIAKEIADNNKELASLDEKIANAYKTKTGQPRKRITKTVLNVVAELEKLKETLPAENERLQEQQVLLEGELDVVKEFVDSVSSMSNLGTDMIDDIKAEMADLKALIGLTKDAIKQTERQLPLIEAIYQRALKLLNNFVDRMVSLNPDIPISIEQYRENMEKFLGEEGAQGVISRNEGFTEQVLDIENTILSYSEGLKFPKHEAKFLDMSKDLKEMQAALVEFEGNLRGQEKILEAFRDFWKQETARQEAEEVLTDNAVVDETLSSSLDVDGETLPFDPDFKPTPLKATHILPTATRGKSFGKDHQERANKFGFNLPKFQAEGKEIQAIYVTSATEESVGLGGLMKKLYPDGTEKQHNEMIVVVMVTVTPEGVLYLVDEDGDAITGEFDILNKAIYQTKPLGDLVQEDGTTMFRKEVTKETREEVVQKYKAWRKEVLGRTEVDGVFTPEASFGFLTYERDDEGNINYDKQTPVSDAGFISDDQILRTKQVLKIPTVEQQVGKGTTEFKTKDDEGVVFKRVLIETPNGYAQVKNRQHTEESATTIYNAIVALSQELVDNRSLKTKKAQRLLGFLKGTIYWGIPQDIKGNEKPVAYSSVFFKKDKETKSQILFVGREKENTFLFTPTQLKNNKGAIIEALKTLYTNTNNKMV
ncbi:MAG: hypothetical protein EX263_12425, partial [Flavobacteriaceae bacterium]